MQESNQYWGEVIEDWAGYSSEYKFKIPYFEKESIIFLDDEFDEDGEEKYAPSNEQLDNYAQTFDSFLKNIDKTIVDIKEKSYERYKRIHSKYYESKNPPLILKDAETHFKYMRDVLYIRVSDDDVVRILIHYDLDAEHGLEIKIQDNKVVAIGGIAET